MLTYPKIDPVIFTIGPIAPRWYGFVYLCGFLYLYFWMQREWRWLGMKAKDEVDNVLGLLILSAILGARFAYVIFYNWQNYAEGPWWGVFAVWQGGLSFHGGIFGVMLGSVLICRVYRLPLLRVWDILLLSVPLAIGFGRIANFINGELWGRVTDVPWAMVFPGAGPEPRHPSQLYESLLEGFLFYPVVLFLWKKRVPAGVISGVFGIWYALVRTFCEQFREPDRQVGFVWGGWTMGQILSVLVFMMGIGLVYYAIYINKDYSRAMASEP